MTGGVPGVSNDKSRSSAYDATTAPADANAGEAHRLRGQSETYAKVAHELVGLVGLLQTHATDGRAGPHVHLGAASQVMTIANVYAWHARASGRIPLLDLVRTVLADASRIRHAAIPLAPLPAEASDRGGRPLMADRDAYLLALAVDALVADAFARSNGQGVMRAALTQATGSIVVEIRMDGRPTTGIAAESIPAGLHGLGLIRALLPDHATVAVRPAGDGIVTSMVLRPPLYRFD